MRKVVFLMLMCGMLFVKSPDAPAQRPECSALWDELWDCARDPECLWDDVEAIVEEMSDTGCI